jgi:ribosome biogenesis GTPase A
LRLERRSLQLGELSSQVADDRFRLIFVGGFDAGKSTLINALLGEKLLPTGHAPLTSAVTVIRYGRSAEPGWFE